MKTHSKVTLILVLFLLYVRNREAFFDLSAFGGTGPLAVLPVMCRL